MFVVFEGIDGSGKTTLSGRVAEELEKQGLSVHQARPKGELKSRLAADIRTLARDPRNLTMSPHTELFLYIARDTQTIDTVIRPSLNKAEVVIADRYLYSPLVLCRARGAVPNKEIDEAISVAARGLWPDLIVYCDVDIDTSAIRKRLQKFAHPRKPDDFGRKGLRGLGLRTAMRNVYLELARENPDTWFTVDNATRTIEENTALIVDKILEVAGKTVPVRPPTTYPEFTRLKSTGEISTSDANRVVDDFYSYIEALIKTGREGEAAYHIRSMDSKKAWAFREQLIDKEPRVIAYGLGPLSCERAMAMRWRLIDKEPERIARSLNAEWADQSDEAWKMREKLEKTAPIEVAMTLGTLDSKRAWSLRERLATEVPGIILSSLKGMDTERSWEMRDRFGKKKTLPGLLRGLAYLDSERAWNIRNKKKKNALPWVILSTLGLTSEEAWDLRECYLNNATKLVIRSMAGLTDERAWALREKAGRYAKETLTTIKGIDTDDAWALRLALKNVWPGPVTKSIGMTLGATEKGRIFLWEMASLYPENPTVHHYLVKAIEMKDRRTA